MKKNEIFINNGRSTAKILNEEEPKINGLSKSNYKTFLRLPSNSVRKGEGGLRTKGHIKKSFTDKPLVTIITVVFNGKNHLEETILSVLNQTYNNIEYIVIDGGSTDGTIDIIRRYEYALDYWVSEPDKGIYDAMNKGISLATGSLIGIINSGDLYDRETISNIVDISKKNPCRNLIITGNVYKINEKGEIQFKLEYEKDFKNKIEETMPLNHPATFISIEVYHSIGLFNPAHEISGDYDFIYRAFHSKKVYFVFTEKKLASMRLNGISEQFGKMHIRAKEQFLIRATQQNIVINFIKCLKFVFVTYFKIILKKTTPRRILALYYYWAHEKIKNNK